MNTLAEKATALIYEGKPFLILGISGPLAVWSALHPLSDPYQQALLILAAVILAVNGLIILSLRLKHRYGLSTHIHRHGVTRRDTANMSPRQRELKRLHQEQPPVKGKREEEWLKGWLDRYDDDSYLRG